MSDTLELEGNALRLHDVERIARGASSNVKISNAARARVEASREVVERVIAENRVVYGISTGFGALAEVVIPPDRIRELQLNLIRSHAAGVGAPLAEDEVRAIALLRANVLALGHSGVRPKVVELLCALLNHRIHPVIPERGSVGASGDLAPLSHLALVLIGEGEAFFQGQRLPGAVALHKAGLEPLVLEAKEGLALNNGTQVQTGIGILAFQDVHRALETAEVAGAMSLEGLRGTPDAFHPAIQRARPHAGQTESATRLRTLLQRSEIRESHRDNDPRVQDAYSLRCMPQVHGAARQALAYAKQVLEIEANSATDNPLIFAEENLVLSGGNFHGQPVAQVLDIIAMVCADLAAISERRIARLIDPALSGLPAFLVREPGVNSGMMMPQIVAAALVADLRLKAHPASVDTIPTDNNKEDHVSMGQGAAIKLREAARLLETVIALELMTAAQALEFLKPLKPGIGVLRAHEIIRAKVPALDRDRQLSIDIEAMVQLVRDGDIANIHRDLEPA
ncbi:MAG TPA: histidine ammonia-lyase [Longimicrobiales bacterium]|nr:histidine ammonia-lyase [Longimicrobiales bacterium]